MPTTAAVDKITLIQGANQYDYWLHSDLVLDSGPDELPTGVERAVERISLRDYSAGIGLDRLPGQGGAYWYNSGFDTRWANRLLLWPAATRLTTMTVTDAAPSYNGRLGGLALAKFGTNENYELHCQYGDRVVQITSPADASPTVTERFNHTRLLTGIWPYYRDTAGATPQRTALIVADDTGGTNSGWYRTEDGITWTNWSPGGVGADPAVSNNFLVVPPSILYWVRNAGGNWNVQRASTPDTGAADLVTSDTVTNTYQRPRLLAVGLLATGALTAIWTSVQPLLAAALVNNTLVNATAACFWYKRNIYALPYASRGVFLLLVNPAQTPEAQILGFGRYGRVATARMHMSNTLPNNALRDRGAFGLKDEVLASLSMASFLNDFYGTDAANADSETVSLDRQQGVHANYQGFTMCLRSRDDAVYMLHEADSGINWVTQAIDPNESYDLDPEGNRWTWVMEMTQTGLFHPIARLRGAAIENGLAVTPEQIYAMVKTSSTTVDVYRIKRGGSPGIPGIHAFEGFTPQAAQFTAANSEYLSIADNTALSMGDIDMSMGCWVRLDSTPAAGNTMGIMGKAAAGDLEYWLQVDNTGGTIRFQFRVRNTGDTTTTTVTASTFGTPTTGTWYFVQAYHDATANTIGIAVNNGAFDTASTSGGIRDGTAPFEIGRHTGGNYLDGRIDAAFVAKEVLTAADWTYLYSSGNGRGYQNVFSYAALRNKLDAWWELDEASGTRMDYHGTNHLADNNTVTAASGISSGPVARLDLPWTGLGSGQDSVLLLYIKALGRLANMNIRVSIQTDIDGAETVLGTITASSTSIEVTANTTLTQARLILESWRDSAGATTDTIDLLDIEIGYKRFGTVRARYSAEIDLAKTKAQRRGRVTHGALLAELESLCPEIVDIHYDHTDYSRYVLRRIRAVENQKDSEGRRGIYRITLEEANTS